MNPKLPCLAPIPRRHEGRALLRLVVSEAVAARVARIPREWTPSSRGTSVTRRRRRKKLARKMFHAMVQHGPKLEREQILLARFVTVGTELFAQTASATRAQALIHSGTETQGSARPRRPFLRRTRGCGSTEAFRGVRTTPIRMGYRLAQNVLADASPWLFEGIVAKTPRRRAAYRDRDRGGARRRARESPSLISEHLPPRELLVYPWAFRRERFPVREMRL